MEPQQYFSSLQNDDLIKFGKQFVDGKLTCPFTGIYGDGMNGKTTYIKLLKILAETNGVRTIFIRSDQLSDEEISIINNYHYVIIQEEDLMNNDIFSKLRCKFIFITNFNPINNLPPGVLSVINMNVQFPSNNICHLDWLDESKKQEFLNYLKDY